MLSLAREKLSSLKGDHLLVLSDVHRIPLQDNRVDIALVSEVLEHVENPKKVLGEIKKITKSDGIIVISIPNEKLINNIKMILQKIKVFNLLFPNISKKMDDEWHLHCFNLEELKKIIGQDFDIQHIQGIPYNWLPLRYVVKMSV